MLDLKFASPRNTEQQAFKPNERIGVRCLSPRFPDNNPVRQFHKVTCSTSIRIPAIQPAFPPVSLVTTSAS